MAENGTYFLGHLLNDSSAGGISPDTILSATSLEDLREEAKKLKRKIELYNKWKKEDSGGKR